jgi:hypothetical protein
MIRMLICLVIYNSRITVYFTQIKSKEILEIS